MPPYVAHVPIAITAHACGARRSIHSHVVIGCFVIASFPIACVDLLVRDRALYDEHEGTELATRGLMERREEILAAERVREHRIVEPHLRQARDGAHHQILDARIRRRRDRDGIAIAAKPRRDPENVDFAHVTSTNPWKLLTSKQRNDACRSELRARRNAPRVIGGDLGDHRRARAERMTVQRRDDRIGVLGSSDDHEPALARDIQRIEPEQLAGRAHAGTHRQCGLVNLDANARCDGELVERARNATARRVAHAADARTAQRHRRELVQRSAVGHDRRIEIELRPQREDRDSMIADRTRDDDAIAGSRRTP